jgi:hypothetical protein
MTKMSANPRKYSKGTEHLNPEQPLNVYLKLRTTREDLELAIGRIQYLTAKHSNAVAKIIDQSPKDGDFSLTIEVSMGPAREALQGTSAQMNAGYQLLWDIAKTLFYTRPVFCSPPSLGQEERDSYSENLQAKQFGSTITKNNF